MRRSRSALAGLALLALAACSTPADPATPAPSGSARPSDGASDAAPDDHSDDAPDDAAVSRPREDSYYPDTGDPGVDALHYDLDLTWSPQRRLLRATETLRLRAAATADSFRLDLAAPLEVRRATLDGAPVEVRHTRQHLEVRHPVTRDDRHTLVLRYRGTPQPVPAPATRSDVETVGWTTTAEGRTWTMQEPVGAYTWYAVNDQPADKARYDITVHVPAPWVGVANGTLEQRRTRRGTTTTRWHLDEPAASYLVTVATGPFREERDPGPSSVPITYWTPPELSEEARARLRSAPQALGWLEDRLGPYPFDSLGFVVVDSESGMETQTMVTLGDTDYSTSEAVVLHEVAHQWYGDQVTPNDWSDVWMNEGMAMYLQLVWQADQDGVPLADLLARYVPVEADQRAQAGPPAAYDRTMFGSGNVYYGPALMWDEVRQRLGDQRFWAMVRAWPSVPEHGTADRAQYLAWIRQETGEDLGDLVDPWLLAAESPTWTP